MGGHRLERARGREDHDEQAAVEHLPDRRGTDRRDHHQQVDVERPVPQCAQPGEAWFPAACRVTGEEEGPAQPCWRAGEAGGEPGGEQQRRQDRPADLRQRPCPRALWPGGGVVLAGGGTRAGEHRGHAGLRPSRGGAAASRYRGSNEQFFI